MSRLAQSCVLHTRYRDFYEGRTVNINVWREQNGYW
jgi:hypothetical protein